MVAVFFLERSGQMENSIEGDENELAKIDAQSVGEALHEEREREVL